MRKWIQTDRAADCAVVIGHAGENGATQIAFDLSGWIGEYGDGGEVTLLLCRPNEKTAYPKTVAREDACAVWTVDSADTGIAGIGKAELRYSVGDTLVKSGIWRVKILPSVTAGGTPPEPYEDLLGKMARLCAKTEEEAEKIVGMRVSAESVGAGEDAAVETGEGETLSLHFRLPRGADGAKGDKGDKGEKGERGEAGAAGPKGETGSAGHTPVRGTDYWTEGDVAEIRGYVDDAILNGRW